MNQIDQDTNQEEPRTVHIYLVDDDLPEEEPNTVESTAPVKQKSRRKLVITLILVGLCFLSLLSGALWYLLSLWATSATVTIIPQTKQITATTEVKINQQVPGRVLSSLTLSQQQTVKTTGRGHQDATQAHGLLTFYNAALSAQTIPAGTLLKGSSGVEVVTDAPIWIPAATLSSKTHASVSAHSLSNGPVGNIHAGDIMGDCCQVGIQVINGPFAGGQDARDYQTATQSDIDQGVSSLKASLTQSTQAAEQAQVKADETLITPLSCILKISTDRQAGDEATEVSITVDETCQGESYNTQVMKTYVTQTVNHKVEQAYALSGDIQIQATGKGNGVLGVKATGSYTYRFTQKDIDHLRAFIAGKTEAEAKKVLLRSPGVQSVSFDIKGRDQATLPGDQKLIQVWVLEQ